MPISSDASAVSELCRKFSKKDLAEWGLSQEAEVLDRRAQADRDRARIEALEGALRPFAEPHQMGDAYVKFSPALINQARAALANTASDNGGQHGHE
jgi:hypothetical protein